MSLTITNQQLKDPLLLRKALEQQKSRYGFKDLVQSNLLRACKLGGLTKSVEVLLSFGATPDGNNAPIKEPLYLQDINTTNTPLQYCVINDDRKSVELLLSQKADPNLRGITGTGKDDDVHLNLPPLHLATRHGHRSMVAILLRAGGSQSPLPETGEYPIHIAAREGHVHLINLFCMSDKSWVNKKTERPAFSTDSSFTSKTPLHVSVEHAHLECVLLLINQFSADVNIKDSRDNNPLHLLLLNSPRDQDDSNARYAIALALLKTDIDLNCENSDGSTPLNLAANNGFPKIAQLLFASKGISSTTIRKIDGNEDLIDEKLDEVSQRKKTKPTEETKGKEFVSKENVEISKPPTTPSYFDPKLHPEPNLRNEEKLEEVNQTVKTKSMEETKSKGNVSKENVEINKPATTYFDPKRYREPNLDNEISSFSISSKDGSERMYVSFDKHQTPKSTINQTSTISKKSRTQSLQTEPKQASSEIPVKVVVTDPEIDSKSKSESASTSEPKLRSRVHTTKVVTVLKETTFWKSQSGDQLNQFFYTPKPENSRETDVGSPVFDPHKTFFPTRQFHRSSSPLSFLSEGNRRGLRMRVSGRVPKAYNKNDMESARKEFFLHPPIGIESTFESADRTHLSVVSLPDLHSKDEVWLKSIQRRMQWLETFKKLNSSSKLKVGPHGKYSPYVFNPKFRVKPKVKGQLIGFFPTPYKSFGPIETKTDALDEAMEDISDFEDDNWDVRNSYQEHYPITNWVKNDGQKICPIEVDNEFLHPDRSQNWITDESDDDRDPKRSSCCSIKIDDVMNIVHIADIDDDKKIKEGPEDPSQNVTRESDLVRNKNKQNKPDAVTSVVASFRPETLQNNTFQLVDVDADGENKHNLVAHQDDNNLIPDQARILSPEVPSNKGKLVKKKTQEDVVHTITVEFIKDPEPHISKVEDTSQSKKKANDTSKLHITRKSSKERSSGVKQPKTISSTIVDQKKGDVNIAKIDDSNLKKKRKTEDNIGFGATDDRNEELFPSKTKTIDLITDSENVKKPVSADIDNLNDKDKDSIAMEDRITNGNIEQPQSDISSEKTSKPKSNAYDAQCVRYKKKTRPTLDNVVNPPDNWPQAVIDSLFLSDKWKDDGNQDSNKESNVISGFEEHESGFSKIDEPRESTKGIEKQDKKESNIDDSETIQNLPKINDDDNKKQQISHDFERSLSKDECKQEANNIFESTSDKKKKRTTKEKADASSKETKFKDSETKLKDNIVQPASRDVKNEDNQPVEVEGNDDNISKKSDVSREKVKRKDSRKKGKTEKTTSIETPKYTDETSMNQKDEIGDKIQPADDSMPPDDGKNRDGNGLVEPHRLPKRKESVKKKKEADDDFKVFPSGEENQTVENKDNDSSLKETTKIRSDDPADGELENRNPESTNDEDLYLPMSNITKDDTSKQNEKAVIDIENNEDITEDNYYVNQKVKKKESKRKTKLDRSASVEPGSSHKPTPNDGDGDTKVTASEDNNMDQDVQKNPVTKKKRGDSKRKSKVDKSQSLERDLYFPTPNDVELEDGMKKDAAKRKTKPNRNRNSSVQEQILNEKQNDEEVEHLKPPHDVNNLDVLIPVDPSSLGDRSSATLKKDGKSATIHTEDKSSLDQIVPRETSGPQKEDSSKPKPSQVKESEKASSQQYYNIIDKSSKDDNQIKQKSKETSLDDYADEEKSKRKPKDGDNLNRSRETNVDDIFQVATEENKTETTDDKASRKSRRNEKKGEATHEKEVSKEPTENSGKFLSPATTENVVRDENAFSDSDFNSSDPDTSHYVEYHVNLGPDYTGKSRIKKAKTMDSTVNFNEDKDFEDRDLETERKRTTEEKNEDIKIKTEPKKIRKKSRKSGEHLGPTLQSTTTETVTERTEILDQETREKQKKKTKIPQTHETTQNEKYSNDDLRQQIEYQEQKSKHTTDKRNQKDRSRDHSVETNIDEVTDDRHETTINNDIITKGNNSDELNNIRRKKKMKSIPSFKQSDHIETNISQSIETDENHRNKFTDGGNIKTNLDDQEIDEKYFKGQNNREDDTSKITEITKTVIDDDETPGNNALRIKKKKPKYGKESDLIEYTTTVVEDVLEVEEDGLKKRIKKDKENKSSIPLNDQKIKDQIPARDKEDSSETTKTVVDDDETPENNATKIKKKRPKNGKESDLIEYITTVVEDVVEVDEDGLKKRTKKHKNNEKKLDIPENDLKIKDQTPKRDEILDEQLGNESLDDEGIGRRKSKKTKKKGENSYLEETVTKTTILDDKWRSTQRDDLEESRLLEDEKMKGFSEEDRKMNDSSPTRGEDEKLTKETSLDEESIGRKKVKKKKGEDSSYLEETMTTTTTVEDKLKSKGRRQDKKESDLKEIEQITDTSGNGRKQKIIQYEMVEDQEEGYEDDAKSNSKKRTQDSFLEETTTTSTTVTEDRWKSKHRERDKSGNEKNIEGASDKTAGKDRRQKESPIARREDEIVNEEADDYDKDKKQSGSKKKGYNGYLEEVTTTTTTVLDDKWKSKQRSGDKSRDEEKDGKTKQFIETDFDCQEPLPLTSNRGSTDDQKDVTPGSKPPLKRYIAPLAITNKNELNRQISSPISNDQDYSTQPLSVTLPNLVIDSPKDDEPSSGGGRVPRQYSSTPKQYEETTVTTTTETIDMLRWKRRPKRRTRSVSFDNLPKKQYQDKPLNVDIPNKTLQQAAFEMLQQSQAEVWRKSWKANPVVYTRGVYKPQQPLYTREGVNENGPGKNDESRISQVFLPSLDDSTRMDSTSPDKNLEQTPNYSAEQLDDFTDEEDNVDDDEHRGTGDHLMSLPANLSPYSKSFSPFLYNSLTRKVTYVKPLRRRRQYNSLSLYPIRGSTTANLSGNLPPQTEPGPVDFTKYGYLSKLWMECVDKKTVQKSNTMYLSVLPSGGSALDSLENTLLRRYLQRSGGRADSLTDPKDGSQWVIARGRSVRLAKRKWMEQKENMLTVENTDRSFHDGSPTRSTINQSFANHPSSMLFFKVDQINWPDLAWILFDEIQSDAETVRTIADIKLKHQEDAGAQIRDLMARWWLKKGDAATIEELQNALEFVQIPYVQEEDENASFFYPARGSDEEDFQDELGSRSMGQRLMTQEVSQNDPDVSRMMIEYDQKSPNVSYAALAEPLQHESSRTSSSRLQVPSMRESKQSLGSVFRDKFRLSNSSLQRSHSNLPAKQESLPMDSSGVHLGSQSSFRAFASGLLGKDHKKAISQEEPVIEISAIDQQDHKASLKLKAQTSSYDLESNL